jgi:cytochrome c553
MLKTIRIWLDRSVSFKAIIIALAVLGCIAAIVVSVGFVDISADKPDSWLAEHLLHFVFKRSEAFHSHDVTPPGDLAAPSRVRLAAQQFEMECANCHGRPGFGQSVIALSMSPRPQYLPNVLGQFTDPELYMIVKHGVKYSAMPSWPTDTRVDEVWSMVAFLRQLPKLNAETYRQMTALPTDVKPGLASVPDDSTLRPANAQRNAPPKNEFLYAAPSTGFADQTVHENPIPTCARCHGADGSGGVTGGEAPNLTIQSADYLKSALQAYTSGARKSGFMQNIAAELSGAQITALSNYYAGLPVKTAPSRPADPALVKRGEAIATGGVPEQAIPACANCHESAGSQIVGSPHIAGQSATYLLRQLHAMSRGGRGSSVSWNPMFAVAHNLSDKDMAALAAYYSGLKPAKAAANGQSAPPSMAPPPENGAKVDVHAAKAIFASVCGTCHIHGGRGDLEGNYPNLTLQATPYVAQSLYEFRTHARQGGKMQEVTSTLNFDQMASLAAYVNSLAPQPALAKPDAAAASRGAAIAANGVPARGVPACLSCHGAKAVAALPLIPRLQGQNTFYLSRKLRNYARAYSSPPNALNPMPAIASPLTDREIADLAAYFASAAPLEKTARP